MYKFDFYVDSNPCQACGSTTTYVSKKIFVVINNMYYIYLKFMQVDARI